MDTAQHADQLTIQLDSDIQQLTQLADAVEQFAEAQGWPMPLTYAFNLSLEEWITNIIAYGHKHIAGHPIEVHLRVVGTTAEAEVIDQAEPFNPMTDAPLPDLSEDISDKKIGGLGIHLMRQMMDEVHYWKQGRKNHLRIVKNLDPVENPEYA